TRRWPFRPRTGTQRIATAFAAGLGGLLSAAPRDALPEGRRWAPPPMAASSVFAAGALKGLALSCPPSPPRGTLLSAAWPQNRSRTQAHLSPGRRTTGFTCRAGCKERDVSKNRSAGPVKCNALLAAVVFN